MSRVEIEPRMAAALKKIKALQGKIEDPAPILDDVGDLFRKTTVSRFYSQTSPTGKRWKRSKAAKRKRRPTLVRTGDLRDSIRAVQSGGKVEIGTDIWYARIHQQGGPIDAQYKQKSGRTKGRSRFALPVTPGVGSAAKLTRAALVRDRIRRRAKARKVRLPRRSFLGVSKRDRKRTTQILVDALKAPLT